MGLKKDLKLTGNEFSNTATWFFIAYLIAEVPNGEFPESPSCPSYMNPSNKDSLLPAKSARGQVARRQRFPLGCRVRLFSRRPELSGPFGRKSVPGHL